MLLTEIPVFTRDIRAYQKQSKHLKNAEIFTMKILMV
jgi:hypothetical protein